VRIIHIVESLGRGAVENWLVRMLAHSRTRQVDADWTFYSILQQHGELEPRAKGLGAHVVHSPVSLDRTASFVRALRAELRRGKYDILHCHHDLVSAVYLASALGLSLRTRVVHVHNADLTVPTPSILKQWLYKEPMRRFCLRQADVIAGISAHTLSTFVGGRCRTTRRDRVHYYGVDPTPFTQASCDRADFRRRHSFLEDSLILLFAGRLVPEKNPVFAVEVLAELRIREPRAIGVFVGAGSLEQQTLARARQLGIDGAVHLLGWRKDLPDIMRCSDWFILPHPEQPMEGFGLAVVEAQLAGLLLLLSTGIADDPLLPGARYRRSALQAGPAAWASAAMDLIEGCAPSHAQALLELSSSPMDMDRALASLHALYA
jgi:glycosyltransferase involved in cell wall biosynthesis